ncbi:acetamidase/formamidase family protein [Leucobacter sp. Marseille-Q4368]|uniref:Acetamidase/formamidase family protein n=1 Tax=Leucobacter manosquensis TaxID=2810611 RepID=A0ABS5M5G3_9MICO|nr:acetamidase/formamidase family protein [Leucobacter manosquensis]
MMICVPATSAITAFSIENVPVAEVALGEVFECETADCYGGQMGSETVLRPEIDMAQFNRATGPVRIAGVEVGDAIRIDVHAIDIADHGVMALSPGLGVLGDRVHQADTRIVPFTDGNAWITPDTPVRIAPMIGVLGVAPAGEAIGSSWPGAHGGNLDTRVLQAGSSLLLRAAHPGALLAVGDLHAVQGDGELGGTGVEVAGRVRLSVERVAYAGRLPAVRHAEGLSILASAGTLDEAVRLGFSEVVSLIEAWRGLSWADAYRTSSVIVRAEVSQMVNPLATVRVTIPREWCPEDLYAASLL